LPGGSGYSDGNFNNAGDYGYWWSATEFNTYNALRRYMYYGYEYVYMNYNFKYNQFSVRCVED